MVKGTAAVMVEGWNQVICRVDERLTKPIHHVDLGRRGHFKLSK
jgi:hypothetical protein